MLATIRSSLLRYSHRRMANKYKFNQKPGSEQSQSKQTSYSNTNDEKPEEAHEQKHEQSKQKKEEFKDAFRKLNTVGLLARSVLSEISFLQNNLFDLREQDEYFNRLGWTYDVDNFGLVTFVRKTNKLEFKALVQITPNAIQDDSEIQAQNQATKARKAGVKAEPAISKKFEKFNEVTLFIQSSKSRWLVCEFIVNSKGAERCAMFFIDNFTGKKINSLNSPAYLGPDPQSQSEEISKELDRFLNTNGIDSELLVNMSVLAANREQGLILRWLKDLKSICD